MPSILLSILSWSPHWNLYVRCGIFSCRSVWQSVCLEEQDRLAAGRIRLLCCEHLALLFVFFSRFLPALHNLFTSSFNNTKCAKFQDLFDLLCWVSYLTLILLEVLTIVPLCRGAAAFVHLCCVVLKMTKDSPCIISLNFISFYFKHSTAILSIFTIKAICFIRTFDRVFSLSAFKTIFGSIWPAYLASINKDLIVMLCNNNTKVYSINNWPWKQIPDEHNT